MPARSWTPVGTPPWRWTCTHTKVRRWGWAMAGRPAHPGTAAWHALPRARRVFSSKALADSKLGEEAGPRTLVCGSACACAHQHHARAGQITTGQLAAMYLTWATCVLLARMESLGNINIPSCPIPAMPSCSCAFTPGTQYRFGSASMAMLMRWWEGWSSRSLWRHGCAHASQLGEPHLRWA